MESESRELNASRDTVREWNLELRMNIIHSQFQYFKRDFMIIAISMQYVNDYRSEDLRVNNIENYILKTDAKGQNLVMCCQVWSSSLSSVVERGIAVTVNILRSVVRSGKGASMLP